MSPDSSDTDNVKPTEDAFEKHLLAARIHLKARDGDEEHRIREYFAVLYQFAPTLAAVPMVAASWLSGILKTIHIGPSEVGALLNLELKAKQAREHERRRILDIWSLLMRDPTEPGVQVQRKLDPEEYELRTRAHNAVMDWIAKRPELQDA